MRFPLPDLRDLPYYTPDWSGPAGDVLDVLIGAALNPHAAAIAVAYFAYLESEAKDKLTALPPQVCAHLQPHYQVNLADVRYAENIDTKTVNGQRAITVETHIYFPTGVDFASCGINYLHSDIHTLAHELEHCVQYHIAGGKTPFLTKYVAQAAGAIIAKKHFDIHDVIALEVDAENKANQVTAPFCRALSPPKRVGLKSQHGYFVCARNGGGGDVLVHQRDKGAWETFDFVGVGGGKVGLRTDNGHFLCAENGGGERVVADRTVLGEWEAFEVIRNGAKVAFRTANGHFLRAKGGGGVALPEGPTPPNVLILGAPQPLLADANLPGPEELFEIV